MGHRGGERPPGCARDHPRRDTQAPAPRARDSPRRRGAPGIRQPPKVAGPTHLAALLGGHAQEGGGRIQGTGTRQEPAGTDLLSPSRTASPLISPLGSGGPRENPSAEEQHNVTIGPDGYLVALKVAIPGDPTKVHDAEGDVAYVINTVAQKNWLSEFSGADDEDLDD